MRNRGANGDHALDGIDAARCQDVYKRQAYVIVASVTGNIKKVRPLMWVAAAAFLAYFLLL